mgnify:CR=1 FL=1
MSHGDCPFMGLSPCSWQIHIKSRNVCRKLRGNRGFPVPVDALREAVINAFAHRQIESGQSIQIMVYRNRIEIYSPGAFPERITPEEFAEGNQKAIRRNKLITQALYYSKDMETFASGLKKIKTLCDEAGVKYEFQKEAYSFTGFPGLAGQNAFGCPKIQARWPYPAMLRRFRKTTSG